MSSLWQKDSSMSLLFVVESRNFAKSLVKHEKCLWHSYHHQPLKRNPMTMIYDFLFVSNMFLHSTKANVEFCFILSKFIKNKSYQKQNFFQHEKVLWDRLNKIIVKFSVFFECFSLSQIIHNFADVNFLITYCVW